MHVWIHPNELIHSHIPAGASKGDNRYLISQFPFNFQRIDKIAVFASLSQSELGLKLALHSLLTTSETLDVSS